MKKPNKPYKPFIQFRRSKVRGRWFVRVYRCTWKSWKGGVLVPNIYMVLDRRVLSKRQDDINSFRTRDLARKAVHEYARKHPEITVRSGTREIKG